jgi:hypothetical protein
MYVQCLDIIPQGNSLVEHAMGLHVLKRAKCASGCVLGEVFLLDQLRSYAHIVPRLVARQTIVLPLVTALSFSSPFFLNKYFNKYFFYAINWCRTC